ncbi:MAG TPA: UvrD-helicase domain-containing protein, partial [Thermoanaerobaculia bacterium]|nr:UvrD-helicase domain-containing protein [Thermoanaerobaculia bacterium]
MADPVADPVADSPLAADRQARRLAQTDFARPLVLEAGAGTGKTTTLVARVLAWCLGPGWVRHQERLEEERKRLGRRRETSGEEIAAATLGRVVAITFTEAAAAEMAERVAQELARLAQAAAEPPAWLVAELPPAGERACRAGALLATLDHLVVRTIHAFCRGLLAAHPLEARLHPELTIDPEGLRVEEVARETVETALRGAYVGRTAAADDPFLALAVAGHGPQKLIEALVTLVQAGVPADGLDEDPTSPARVAALRGRIATAAARLHALLAPHAGSLKHNAGKLLTALTGLGDRLGQDLPSILATLAEDFPDPGKGLFNQLAKWRAGDFNKSEQAVLAASAAEISAAAADLRAVLRHAGRLDPELLALAHRALGPLLRTVRRELRGRGVVTFEDLLAEAARLLATRGDVAARERARIDQLLVDEFQDTDLLQCEIVARLALDGPAERRPGLFLVGDPKQSIYGWRSADLGAYDGFLDSVLGA